MSKELFNIALKLVLKYEGNYVNNPNDPGGETNKGIIKTEYDAYRTEKGLPIQSVKYILDEEVEDIYYNKYWTTSNCDIIEQTSSKLAIVHFDTAVNTGIKQASKFLQRALGVTDDGIVGAGTLKALKDNFKDTVIENYLQQRKEFYKKISDKKPTLKVFLKGWLKRVDNLSSYIKGYN